MGLSTLNGRLPIIDSSIWFKTRLSNPHQAHGKTYLASTHKQLNFLWSEPDLERGLIRHHVKAFLEGSELTLHRLVQKEIGIEVYKLLLDGSKNCIK